MGDLRSPDFFVFQTCDIRTNHVGANTVRPSCRLYNLWYSYVASAFCNLHGLLCRKIAVALCGFYFVQWDRKKRCRDFFSDTALLFLLLCYAFKSFSAPLSRLTPIEALPQAPQGLCPLTPQALWRRA